MIRVAKQPEPKLPDFDFDGRVRKPGLSALAELTGKEKTIKRRGVKIKKRAESEQELHPSILRKYAYWTRAIPALHAAYRGICAYSCFRIELIHGPTVDHFVAITSSVLSEAYEWDNYRLACSVLNSCKREFPDVLDPFAVEDAWFRIDFATFRVEPADRLDSATRGKVLATINRLKLNEECRLLRERYFNDYWNPVQLPAVPLWYFEREAPFLAREMRRQGRVRPEDANPVPKSTAS